MLTPSELSIDWLQNSKDIDCNTPKLLYVGRFKKRKRDLFFNKFVK